MNVKTTRLADLVADFCFTQLKINKVFTVTGGGAMYLNDAFGKHRGITVVPMHHEQSASMAAEGYFRQSGAIAVCQVTTGPGGTNAITGCAGAWVDSESVFFISGQVESISIAAAGNRQTGVQELDIVSMVKGITKDSIRLQDPYLIRYELERLSTLAVIGRPGPVWLDIPLDMQNFAFERVDDLPKFLPPNEDKRVRKIRDRKFNKLLTHLARSERPLLLLGNGSRSEADNVREFIQHARVPVVTGWNARDIAVGLPHVLGSAGLFGNRAANLAIQKADLLLGIGYRFSVPQTGYDPSCYAPHATIAAVEVDLGELNKLGAFIDLPINGSVAEFLEFYRATTGQVFSAISAGWIPFCNYLINSNFDRRPANQNIINSFDFNGVLSEYLRRDDTVVTDMGTSFTCTHQDLALSPGIRLFTSSGVAAMGFGLPGAIGCSLAKSIGRTVLITGDGGLMFSLQELQTVRSFNLNLRIIVYENGGYLTMKHMQEARFKTLVGSDQSTRLECADFAKVASALSIESLEVSSPSMLPDALRWLLGDFNGPRLLVVHIDPWQPLLPRVQTRSDASGKLFPPSLDQMYPHLSEQQEFDIERQFNTLCFPASRT